VSLLSVDQLTTWFSTPIGTLRAVNGVSVDLDRGQTLGLVGESGSGKSVFVRSIMGIQPRGNLARFSGHVWFDGVDLATLSTAGLRSVWGRRIGIVPQNPLSSLNPVVRIGPQITEILRYRLRYSRRAAQARAVELMQQVGIPSPERRLREYPHQLSGGMRQRVAIAMALAGEPDLLIADEPTTALDVTVQAQILALMQRLQRERQMAMIFVSHDLAVVAGLADEIAVMYAGRIVERGPARAVVDHPKMPYTEALLRASPRLEQARHVQLAVIPGRPPNMIEPLSGCPFHPRCFRADELCGEREPPLVPARDDRREYACWFPVESNGW
jgi:oligopeptide/dipeptide ABC transporter ATP-binding protein